MNNDVLLVIGEEGEIAALKARIEELTRQRDALRGPLEARE